MRFRDKGIGMFCRTNAEPWLEVSEKARQRRNPLPVMYCDLVWQRQINQSERWARIHIINWDLIVWLKEKRGLPR